MKFKQKLLYRVFMKSLKKLKNLSYGNSNMKNIDLGPQLKKN